MRRDEEVEDRSFRGELLAHDEEAQSVLLDEPCPHCRVMLQLRLPREAVGESFACPECGKGLVCMRHLGSKLMALVGTSLSAGLFSFLFLVPLLILYLCVEAISSDYTTRENAILIVGAIVMLLLSLLIARTAFANLRVGWRVLTGAKLLPVIRHGNSYRYEANPLRFKFRRSKKGEELLGAVSISSEEDALHGALTQDPQGK